MRNVFNQLQRRLRDLRVAAGFSPDWFLIPLAGLIGVLGGLVAAGFGTTVEWLSERLFSLQHGESPVTNGILIIVIPAVGGLIVGLMQSKFSKTGPVHGVPEIIESLARERGQISASMGVNKAITSTCTLASGGSAGVEGPIITIGASLGSQIGQRLRIKPEHYPTLIGCGAASAMAGIFNAPIAGVLFVLEVILRDFSVRTFMPIVIASVFGTAVAQQTMSSISPSHSDKVISSALFTVPQEMQQYQFELPEAPAYLVLGLGCAITGLTLAGAIRFSNKLWNRTPIPKYLQPGVGGLLLGLMGLLFIILFPAQQALEEFTSYERPIFMGNGYPVIESLMDPGSYANAAYQIGPLLLLAIIGFKVAGTALTIGSGGSGGAIAPSLFVGAATGALLAESLNRLGIFPGATPATYALAGMAGVIAATLHCPLTAFLLVFEITRDYRVILPVMLVAIVSTTCAQFMHRDSIYTDILRRKGIRFGQLADMTLLRRMRVAEIDPSTAVLVQPEDPAQRLIDLATQYAVSDYVVVDDNEKYVGMVVGDDVRTTLLQREAVPLMIVGELMRSNLPTVSSGETLDSVLDKFSKHEVSSLPLIDPDGKIAGMITRSRLMRHYQQQLDKRG